MARLVAAHNLGSRLGIDLSKPSALLTESDLEIVLERIPRSGHTGMALRRRVANAKAKLWMKRARGAA
jgi:hypothetical protein